MEFLDRPLPRERIVQSAFETHVVLREHTTVLALDRDARIQSLWVLRSESGVRANHDLLEQSLRVRGLDPFRFQLSGAYLIVEKRRRDQIFEVVVRLLLGLRIV